MIPTLLWNFSVRLLNLDCTVTALSSASVGQQKHLLDLVDVNLPLAAIIPAFGRYLQYKVNFKNDDAVAAADISENVSLLLPEPVQEKNRKDVLYIHIISFSTLFQWAWHQKRCH